MATKKSQPDKALRSKARLVLKFAEERSQQVTDWLELHLALFGVHGKATRLFPTEAERTAFNQTDECKQIYALFNTLPAPPVQEVGELPTSDNGAISVRLPRSVHDALLAEAKAEGVSLTELCAAKLVAQLRTVVGPANGRAGQPS